MAKEKEIELYELPFKPRRKRANRENTRKKAKLH